MSLRFLPSLRVHIVSLENRPEQRQWLRLALDLIGRPYALHELASPRDLESIDEPGAFRLALVPACALEDSAWLAQRLRKALVDGRIVAYGQFAADDEGALRQLHEGGVDVVIDDRVSASKLAMLLARCLQPRPSVATESIGLTPSALRRAMRIVAPTIV